VAALKTAAPSAAAICRQSGSETGNTRRERRVSLFVRLGVVTAERREFAQSVDITGGKKMKMGFVLIGVLGLAAAASASPAVGASVIDEWATAKAEPAPELKPATLDPKTSALLVMDLVKGSCNAERRPRCVASIPTIEKFLTEARGKGVTIIHTVAGSGTVADILPPVAPKEGETVLTGTVANKFIRTPLEKTLKDKGITTVIPVGTAAHGAVLYTGSEAAFLQFKVAVPVDGASSENLFAEQAVAWLFARAPGVSNQTTLTRFDMIKFQ
jgi:nicotinamidase-related amidase